jgi:ADP-ribosyl-[dinitrogen reductase] hydrolase
MSGRRTEDDRAIGSLVGLAVGDAVGTTVEFEAPGTFAPLTDMVGGGPFDLKAGEWTDDTSMALCLAESLVERRAFDPVDQLQRYIRWWKEGHFSVKGHCFDIGNQVEAALADHLSTSKPFCGPVGPRNAGNGSLMRLCPVAIAYLQKPADAVDYAGQSSRTTHGNPECVDACRYFAGMLVGAMRGVDKETLLGPMYAPAQGLWEAGPLQPKVAAIAGGSFKRRQPPDIKGTGYVIDCLEAALWAFDRTDSFEQAILQAANLGDDADTTAAVCGQIAGAFYGRSGIPAKWLAKLAQKDVIEGFAATLLTIEHR